MGWYNSVVAREQDPARIGIARLLVQCTEQLGSLNKHLSTALSRDIGQQEGCINMWKIRARISGRARGRMKSLTGAAQDRHGPETLPGELLSATLESSNLTWSARASTGHNT